MYLYWVENAQKHVLIAVHKVRVLRRTHLDFEINFALFVITVIAHQMVLNSDHNDYAINNQSWILWKGTFRSLIIALA